MLVVLQWDLGAGGGKFYPEGTADPSQPQAEAASFSPEDTQDAPKGKMIMLGVCVHTCMQLNLPEPVLPHHSTF